MSGNASIGMFLKAIIPAIINTETQKNVNTLFLSEKAIIFLINLFNFFQEFNELKNEELIVK